jgi:anoctamin-10/anoctamin-7
MAMQAQLSDAEFYKENGYAWDFVMVFKIYDELEVLSEYQIKYSMERVIKALARGGLETKLFYSVQHDEVFCKIRCPLARLKQQADCVDYKLQLDPVHLKRMAGNGWPSYHIGPIQLEMSGAHGGCMSTPPRDPYEHIFGEYKQEDDMQDLYKLYGPNSRRTPFRSVDRMRLITDIVRDNKTDTGCHLDPTRMLKEQAIMANYPLHDTHLREQLQREWLAPLRMPNNQPFTEIKDYFGEKIALYFAWLGHYTTWLIAPSIIGVLTAANVYYTGDPDSDLVPFFGLFMCLWSTFFLEFWKRRNATLAMEWGMTEFEEEEQDRPQFEGELVPSPINGEMIKRPDPKRQLQRFTQGCFVVFTMVSMVLGVVTGIYYFRFWATQADNYNQFSWLGLEGKFVAGIIASALNAVQIQVMGAIYQGIAVRMTDRENHRTDTAWEDALITKIFIFQFVNSYGALFYIAFIKVGG